MSALARFVTGRRTKFAVIAMWILAAAALGGQGSKLDDVTEDGFASLLPENVEATEVQNLLRERFPGGETANGLIVYRREGGLTAADRTKIARDAGAVADVVPLEGEPVVPFADGSPPALVSPGGDAAYTVVTTAFDFEKQGDWGNAAREAVGSTDEGPLEVYVTGTLGIGADYAEVFESVDAMLLIATVLLVLVLLGAIYRAPLIAVAPILVVGFASLVANGLIYLYADAGHTVNSNSTQILVVLMFGVGTDYCLLLVSRYREELRRVEDKHEAMERALRRAAPALIASGGTVIAAMLVLLLADAGSTNGLGPVSALGVGSVLLAALTLFPALLTWFGRTGFWPRRDSVAYDPEAGQVVPRGLWRRFGDSVLRRPGIALAVTVALFAAGTLGLLVYQEDYSIGGGFKTEVESVQGFDVLAASFDAGQLDPTAVIVRRAGGAATDADVAAARERLETIPRVASVSREPVRSEDGALARIDVAFEDDPYADAALARVDVMRERLDDLGPGVEALVGSGSALQTDFNRTAERDLRVIVPVALLVITVILAVLLQAIVAPLVLILTVIASFFGTLGLSIFFFIEVLGDRGVDASLPTFAFIFLVALGVDYTIFLMSRVREEARIHGTPEGTLRALAATGPVITSAGVILAGTFSVLMTMPVTFAFNIGFMVAVGILLDTFVVRTVMVPAAVELLGDRVWWPSTAEGGGRALREASSPRPSSASPASTPPAAPAAPPPGGRG
jgi:RND superfamily putative drug exporter